MSLEACASLQLIFFIMRKIVCSAAYLCVFLLQWKEKNQQYLISSCLEWNPCEWSSLSWSVQCGAAIPKKLGVLSAGWWLRVERVHLTSEVSCPDDVWIKWWEMIKEETIMSKWDVIFVNRWISPSSHDLMFAFTQRLWKASVMFSLFIF